LAITHADVARRSLRVTNLHPDYYDFFPKYPADELRERLTRLPFHMATLLGPDNLRTALAFPETRGRLQEYFALPPTAQRSLLVEILNKAGISIATSNAIHRVPRETFTRADLHHLAHLNLYLPFAEGSGLTPPGLVALMIDRLDLRHGQRILELGIGAGYHSACINECLDGKVVIHGVELNEAYHAFGAEVLSRLKVDSVTTNLGDALRWRPDELGYDIVFFTASSLDGSPQALVKAAKEGGLVQYIRPLTPDEYNREAPGAWLRRTFQEYSAYRSGEWRQYCCLATAVITEGSLAERDQLYCVTFVPLHPEGETVDTHDESLLRELLSCVIAH